MKTVTIELDEDVFAQLQAMATPLVDSVSDVIRRALPTSTSGSGTPLVVTPIRGNVNGHRKQRTYDEGISMKEYRPYILAALLLEGGSAHLSKVKSFIKGKVGHRFDQHDLSYTQSNAVVWENRVEWQRLEMRNDGLIKADSPRGIWELTERGIAEAKRTKL